MLPYIKQLAEQLSLIADETKAPGMKAYMKNQFHFLGIQMDARRKAFKVYAKENPINSEEELVTICRALWQMPTREYQYCAVELMASYKTLWSIKMVDFFEYCITHKSWWDTVDFICTELLAPFFKLFPAQTIELTNCWNKSDNIWLQRSSLLFQKPYKKETDTIILARYTKRLKDSKEFFIQKAIGWILREYAKTNPQWVIAFVKDTNLAPLSKREALKHLK